MKEDILNYLPTDIFRGTPCIFLIWYTWYNECSLRGQYKIQNLHKLIFGILIGFMIKKKQL